MKNRKYFKIIIQLSLSLFLLYGCQNKKADPAPTTIAMGTLKLHLHTYLDVTVNNEVDSYNAIYTTATGRKISPNLAQLYISNIQLVKLDGSLYTIADTILLQVQEQEDYVVANVPADKYKSVRFYVGLSAEKNKKSPSNSSTDKLNTSNMWFENPVQPDGYIFLNLQGKIDTTINATGAETDMQSFTYKIGTDANYKQVSMPDFAQTLIIPPNGSEFIHLYTDYNKLFTGVQLNNPDNLIVNSEADNTKDVATKIRNNIPSMFSYEFQ